MIIQFSVTNYNTGNDPNPEVLFTGSRDACDQYVLDQHIPMKGSKQFPSGIGIEIEEVAA